MSSRDLTAYAVYKGILVSHLLLKYVQDVGMNIYIQNLNYMVLNWSVTG